MSAPNWTVFDPTTCDNCWGRGVGHFPSPEGYEAGDQVECPSCLGRGWVNPPEPVRFAERLHSIKWDRLLAVVWWQVYGPDALDVITRLWREAGYHLAPPGTRRMMPTMSDTMRRVARDRDLEAEDAVFEPTMAERIAAEDGTVLGEPT